MLQAKGGGAGCVECSNQRLNTGKEAIAMTLMIRNKKPLQSPTEIILLILFSVEGKSYCTGKHRMQQMES